MNKTPIEWVKNPDGTQGYTWNPLTGCLNHTPEGLCLGGMFPCYAYKGAHRRLRERYLANKELAPVHYGTYKSFEGEVSQNVVSRAFADPFYPRFWEDRLMAGYAFMQNHKPMGIFPCDMSDWCGIGIPESWSNWILEMARRCPQHRFYLLTKQPQNLPQWSPFPSNCYVGVSVTRNNQLADALKYLKQIEAKVKFISFEPLLERLELDI